MVKLFEAAFAFTNVRGGGERTASPLPLFFFLQPRLAHPATDVVVYSRWKYKQGGRRRGERGGEKHTEIAGRARRSTLSLALSPHTTVSRQQATGKQLRTSGASRVCVRTLYITVAYIRYLVPRSEETRHQFVVRCRLVCENRVFKLAEREE